jgi:hypothetical protein
MLQVAVSVFREWKRTGAGEIFGLLGYYAALMGG